MNCMFLIDSLTSDDSSEPAQSVLELPNVDILPPFTTAFTSTVMSNPTQTLIKISKVSNTNPSSSLLSSYLMKKVIHIKEQLSNSSPKDQFHVTQNMINSECTFSSPPLGITQNMNQSQNQQQKYYTAGKLDIRQFSKLFIYNSLQKSKDIDFFIKLNKYLSRYIVCVIFIVGTIGIQNLAF